MKRVLAFAGALAGFAGALWAILRRRRAAPAIEPFSVTPPPPIEALPPLEPAPPSEADAGRRELESRLDEETKYDRAIEAEAEDRHRAAERVTEDPLTERLESPPGESA